MRVVHRAVGALAVTLILSCAHSAAAQPPEAVDMLDRVVKNMQAVQARGDFPFGPLSGLWRRQSDSGEGVTAVWHIENGLIEYVVDQKTGALHPVGVAERQEGQWRGWFGLVCRGCCPGVQWWDRGTVVESSDKRSAAIRVRSKRMDRDKCVLTNEPDDVEIRLEAVRALRFKELIPGKLISIVAAPAVGHQAAQYKAQVTVQWNLAGLPVHSVEIVSPGGTHLVPKTSVLQGEQPFLTDRSGTYRFLLAAWNREGKPLHIEATSIEIPAIPGIGR